MGTPSIYLYVDRAPYNLHISEILGYLSGLGLDVIFKGDFFETNKIKINLAASELARCRVHDISKKDSQNLHPRDVDIQTEIGILNSQNPMKLAVDMSNIYEGFCLTRFLRAQIKRGLHVIFTSRMFATFEGKRFHGRTLVMDFPLSLISTTGIVEAPIRPSEFYIKQAAYYRAKEAGMVVPVYEEYMNDVKENLEGRFVDYNDPRLTELVKGYTLQAIFYLLFGEIFCEDPGCRLYNAHTQEEMIHAQIKSGRLCKHHKSLLKGLLDLSG